MPAAPSRPSTMSPTGTLGRRRQHTAGGGEAPQPIVVAVRVRPAHLRAVQRIRPEEGYPFAEQKKLAALRLEDAERASIACLSTQPNIVPSRPRTHRLLTPVCLRFFSGS